MYDINTVLSTRRSFGEWKISVETQWPQTPATELLLSQVMCAGWWFLSQGASHGSLCSSLSLWP